MKSKTQILSIIFTVLFSVSVTLANNTFDAAANALAAKMQKDLSIEKVQVKFSDVQSYNVSKTLIGLKGVGMANDLPIEFDVKLNRTKLVPTLINYHIVESLDADSLAQEKLSKKLLKKLSRDFNNSTIVIAIDGTEKENLTNNQTKISGNGEVRIGLEWKKIEFEVIENEQVVNLNSIKYKIQ